MIYLNHLLKATNGLLAYPGKQSHFDAFSHDTRQLIPGEMFVAVRGEHGDGHDYLLDALQRGAAGLLLEARALASLAEEARAALGRAGIATIAVADTRLALQQYARFILERWHPTVIAVTGSVGKTSTKEAIAAVLSGGFATFRSWQNYNDLLGLPLSLGRLEERHEYAVLELACDHPGEIRDLCRIIQPHIGVLTNISPAQLQYFGTVEQLAGELGSLLSALPQDGMAFVNGDDKLIRSLTAQCAAPITAFVPSQARDVQVTWDGVGAALHTQFIAPPKRQDKGKNSRWRRKEADGEGRGIPLRVPFMGPPGHPQGDAPTLAHDGPFMPRLDLNLVPIAPPARPTSHLLGAHHISTMLAAYMVGTYCGLKPGEIEHALANVYPLPGRLNPLPGIDGTRLLDDTHNAAPAAVLAGLETLKTLPAGRRIAVLGDMLSLGHFEEEAHRMVGQYAASCVDYLILRGEHAEITAAAAREAGLPSERIIITATHEDAAQAARRIVETGQHSTSHHTKLAADVILVKGSEETRMERVTERLMAEPAQASEKLVRQTPGWKQIVVTRPERPTWVEIDLSAIAHNTHQIQVMVGPRVRILASLKADAYGHGALKVARTVLHNGASMLGVATVSEALPLREAGVNAPILVFGYVPPWQMREAVRLGLTITLYSVESAQALSRAALALGRTVPVHVKVDTGMGRLGIRAERVEEVLTLVREILALPGLEFEGIFTHFAMADTRDQTHVRMQLARFQNVLLALEKHAFRPPLVHAANSAATITLPETYFDMVRPGIALYGLDPSDEVHVPEGFRPALSFKTQVAQVKLIPEEECISYGCTYVTGEPTRVAILPVGYADGFRRGPTNWRTVLLHGQEAPILGRVCMDQCMVDVSHIPQTRVGDEVVLIGRQGSAALTAEKVAQRLGTSNYEVVSAILARVPRVD